MRIALFLAALLMGSAAAFADDIVIRADIAEATVFLSGAEVTRRGTVSVPPGTHRLLIAMPDAAQADRIEVSGSEGLRIGPPQLLLGHVIAEGALDDPEQATARAAVQAANEAWWEARNDLAAAYAVRRGLEAQQSYLAALSSGGPDGASMPADMATLSQNLATLGSETTRVEAGINAAEIENRALADVVADRYAALVAATANLARLTPFDESIDGVEVTVTADTEMTVEVAIDYLSDAVHWEPSYEFHLDSDTGALKIERLITVFTGGTARWQDVAMTFSTAEPNRPRSPSELSPTPARIFEPAQIGLMPQARFGDAAPAMEMVAAAPQAVLQTLGLSISYAYSEPVSISAGGQTTLPLESLALETQTEARAVPRTDATAFLVALGQNDSGEPILPGQASFFRDFALVGEDMIDMIADGAEIELAFGPLDHLRLIWIDRSLAEGDRGIFVTANTQERRIAFGVENTGDRSETLRLLYATPFAEQEDLRLSMTLAPQPNAVDVDDLRGVQAWAFSVAPGETKLIEMSLSFAWPEGQELIWQP